MMPPRCARCPAGVPVRVAERASLGCVWGAWRARELVRTWVLGAAGHLRELGHTCEPSSPCVATSVIAVHTTNVCDSVNSPLSPERCGCVVNLGLFSFCFSFLFHVCFFGFLGFFLVFLLPFCLFLLGCLFLPPPPPSFPPFNET